MDGSAENPENALLVTSSNALALKITYLDIFEGISRCWEHCTFEVKRILGYSVGGMILTKRISVK